MTKGHLCLLQKLGEMDKEDEKMVENGKQASGCMNPLNTSSNGGGTAGGLGIHPSESWVVWVCV